MKGIALFVWVAILGILFFGKYFVAVFVLELLVFAVLYHFFPKLFDK